MNCASALYGDVATELVQHCLDIKPQGRRIFRDSDGIVTPYREEISSIWDPHFF